MRTGPIKLNNHKKAPWKYHKCSPYFSETIFLACYEEQTKVPKSHYRLRIFCSFRLWTGSLSHLWTKSTRVRVDFWTNHPDWFSVLQKLIHWKDSSMLFGSQHCSKYFVLQKKEMFGRFGMRSGFFFLAGVPLITIK